MKHTQQKRSFLISILIVLLILLALGGIGGGAAMLVDPSGGSMSLPSGLLDGLPISTFILPGIFLITVMGIVPLVIAYGLSARKSWAWLANLGQGTILVLWILFQIILWGSPMFLQYLYLGWGIVLIILGLLPSVKTDLTN